MNPAKRPDVRIHVYGPVPSRRLGYSLGVDILPYKTCTLDCLYCQLGPTPKKTIRRKSYFEMETVLSQIQNALQSGQEIDYITFSGSGEPTLNASLGKLIRNIKAMTNTPVAVLTNGTLLTSKSVRKALLAADLVVPSLDAASQTMFTRVNRPHKSLKINAVVKGLQSFSEEFKGRIWLEIMLMKNINDSPEHIRELKKIVDRIRPDKVQLNTVIRPPADDTARPLSYDELERIRKIFGERCEIIADFSRIRQTPRMADLEVSILETVRRRPVTLFDLAASLGKHQDEVLKHLNHLLDKNQIKAVSHETKTYYEPADGT